MARVDFYILDRVEEDARYMLACKLAEKAWRLDNKIYIHTMNVSDAKRLDDLLWTFRDGSFVPHALADSKDTAPIMIGYGDGGFDDKTQRDLLISLCDDIPGFVDSYPRVAELVTADKNCKLQGRKRFAQYRELGHQLETYKL